MKILVVEADAEGRARLEAGLAANGHEVRRASTAAEAARGLRDGEVRLAFCGSDSGGLSGIEVCRVLRGEYSRADVYLVAIQPEDLERHGPEVWGEQLVEAFHVGVDEFLDAPVDLDELPHRVQRIERMLGDEEGGIAGYLARRLMESRDREMEGHLERVRHYARLVAERLRRDGVFPEIDSRFVETIYLTSPLHDIGKTGISDEILKKPGPLTSEEFELIKQHTTLGGRSLQQALERYPAERNLRMARDIALAHHERYDGAGYPRGLRGDAIPLAARIVALVDVYDALTSSRCYKDAWAHEEAVRLIERESGGQFDPRIVRAFLDIRGELPRIRSLVERVRPVS